MTLHLLLLPSPLAVIPQKSEISRVPCRACKMGTSAGNCLIKYGGEEFAFPTDPELVLGVYSLTNPYRLCTPSLHIQCTLLNSQTYFLYQIVEFAGVAEMCKNNIVPMPSLSPFLSNIPARKHRTSGAGRFSLSNYGREN